MIAARFRLVGWVAGVAGAALVCYMASQSVAAERSALSRVDAEIADTRSDIMRLTTEITARSRAGQVERWNGVLALQAARPAQYVDSGIQLASLAGGKPLPLDPQITGQAAVQMAAYQPDPAPATHVSAPVAAIAPPVVHEAMLRQATFVRPQSDRLGGSAAPVLIKASYEKPALARTIEPAIEIAPKPLRVDTKPKLADAKPIKAMEKIARAIDPKPKALDLTIADARPAARKSKPLGLLPDDFGKLVAAERKAKSAKGAL